LKPGSGGDGEIANGSRTTREKRWSEGSPQDHVGGMAGRKVPEKREWEKGFCTALGKLWELRKTSNLMIRECGRPGSRGKGYWTGKVTSEKELLQTKWSGRMRISGGREAGVVS